MPHTPNETEIQLQHAPFFPYTVHESSAMFEGIALSLLVISLVPQIAFFDGPSLSGGCTILGNCCQA
jgi:hypothetical protein